MIFRETIHGEIHLDDVRVIVFSPNVKLTVASGIAAVAVRLPVWNAVNAVSIFFFSSALQSAPNEMFNVIIERLDFALHRILRVLRREKRRLAQAGIIARHCVNSRARYGRVIVGTDQFLSVHVPIRDKAVVPFAGITMLGSREKRAAFFDQRLERFGGKKFQKHLLVFSVVNGQAILAEF